MNVHKFLSISLIINVVAIGYIAISIHSDDLPADTIISNSQRVEKISPATHAKHYPGESALIAPQLAKALPVNHAETLINGETTMNESMSVGEHIQPIEMVMDILGDNYQGALTEDNLLSVGTSLLSQIIENPSYSESQRLDAFYGLQTLASNSETYLMAASTLLGDALYSDDTEHQAELLYQLDGVATPELADTVSQFLLNPDRDVRVAALSALARDKNNKYAQDLLAQHASLHPQDMLDYLDEIQVAAD